MKTLTKEAAGLMAKLLSRRVSTCYNDDLIAILGTGWEADNEKAIQSWLLSRYTDDERCLSENPLEQFADALEQHINDMRMEVAIGIEPELSCEFEFLPSKKLTCHELRCIAKSIYLLVLGEGTRPYLDGLLGIMLAGEGSVIDKLIVWVSSQTKGYTHIPSELTIPLAQRLMKRLKQAGEGY